ncbi:hypothetical protein L1987_81564 [Smallanthus sonchifolius]|uniref:Uncharacterized protein n=1 Tax=Smallanthus sonchifolius TaxID=185202 RepID=A0ACB8YQY5_9ASTR|nr:hypothetical protein L1987_81564 [Smallanthus sonchifolius]
MDHMKRKGFSSYPSNALFAFDAQFFCQRGFYLKLLMMISQMSRNSRDKKNHLCSSWVGWGGVDAGSNKKEFGTELAKKLEVFHVSTILVKSLLDIIKILNVEAVGYVVQGDHLMMQVRLCESNSRRLFALRCVYEIFPFANTITYDAMKLEKGVDKHSNVFSLLKEGSLLMVL